MTTIRSTAYRPPYRRGEVRHAYWEGLWRYCIGRPAQEHPRYAEALERVEGWDPWWVRTWQDVEAALAGCRFDCGSGARVCNFFERVLRHTKNGLGDDEPAGRPVRLMDWVRWDILMPLFGWRRPDGTRRYRKASIWIPKKNSKSFTCSGLGLYLLAADGEASAEVYAAALTRKQAGIVWDEARQMLRRCASRKLKSWLVPHESAKTITKATDRDVGVFVALPAEAGPVEGLNASAVIFDEVHVQRDRAFYEALAFAGIARRQPLLIQISTAGVYDPNSIGWEEYSDAKRIHEGSIVNWETYVYIAKAAAADDWFAETPGQADDWRDPRVLAKANPGIGITIRESEILSARDSALLTPRKQPAFLRYRCNVWVRSSTRWMDVRTWQSCLSDDPDYVARLDGLECWGGLDLSLTTDITAFVLVFPPQGEIGKWRIVPHFYLPSDNIDELERGAKAPYRQWAESGLLHLTPGEWVDYGYVREHIQELSRRYRIRRIGYDPWRAQETVQALMDYGLEMLEVPQVMSRLCGPTEDFDGRIRRREVEHMGHPVYDWQIANAQALYDTKGNYYLTKSEKKVRLKVDGIIATVIAMAAYSHDYAHDPGPSVYEERGFLTL